MKQQTLGPSVPVSIPVAVEKRSKPRRMSRSNCPICGLANTFIVDKDGYFEIRLCVKCAKENGYPIDFSNTSKCLKCGEVFIEIKSSTCPVCWIKHFEEEERHGKNKIY